MCPIDGDMIAALVRIATKRELHEESLIRQGELSNEMAELQERIAVASDEIQKTC